MLPLNEHAYLVLQQIDRPPLAALNEAASESNFVAFQMAADSPQRSRLPRRLPIRDLQNHVRFSAIGLKAWPLSSQIFRDLS